MSKCLLPGLLEEPLIVMKKSLKVCIRCLTGFEQASFLLEHMKSCCKSLGKDAVPLPHLE